MADICFIGTETTSLRHDRRAWEIGIIARSGDRKINHHWIIDAGDLDLGNADLFSLKIGRFHERHPQASAHWTSGLPGVTCEARAMAEVEEITRGAHLAGAVVSFDADVLGQRMRAHGICPSWHYHLIDVEALAVGFLSGLAAHGHSSVTCSERCLSEDGLPGLPWKSDDLSAAVGVKVSDEDRHTALGDARWARDIYDAVMGGAS